MACDPNLGAVDVDVDNGEYLAFEVSFKGASAIFSIVSSTTGQVLLDPTDGPVEGPFESIWPETGDPANKGKHKHAFVADFLTATDYTLTVKLCWKSGSTKRNIKNCEWSVGGRRPKTGWTATVV
jgi:hypothetical protein